MFTDIDALTAHLETSAFDYRFHHQIAEEFRPIRDAADASGDPALAETCQWEMDVFNYEIAKNKLIPMWSSVRADGTPVQCPDPARWDSRAYDYIECRFTDTQNPLLRSRYGHVLWLGPRRSHVFARASVDAYFTVIQAFEMLDKKSPTEMYGVEVMHTFENLLPLAFQIGYRKDEVIREARRLLFRYSRRSSSSYALRATIVETLLSGRSPLHRQGLSGAQKVCWDVGNTKRRRKDFHAAIDLFQHGEKVDKRLAETTFDWNRAIAESYEAMASDAESKGNLAATDFCLKAVDYYRKCKDAAKVSELRSRYGESRKKSKLGRIEAPVDMKAIQEFAEGVARQVVATGQTGVLQHLAVSETILPRLVDVEKRAIEQRSQFVMRQLMPIQILDANGHPSQHFVTDEEKLRYSVLWNYNLDIQIGCLPMIEAIMVKGIQEGFGWVKSHSILANSVLVGPANLGTPAV